MDERYRDEGPAFRRRKKNSGGMGSFSFLVIVVVVGVAATVASSYLSDPVHDMIQSWIGLDLRQAEAPHPPPAPMSLN